MSCFEHDYESVFCRNCGGYCGMACVNCGTMTDGGESTYVTMEWCHCDNQVFDFGFEEPEGYEQCSVCHKIAYRNGVCESCGFGESS